MFRRVLLANRGEVAARVARTARRMGVGVVAVVSDADAELSWLELADEVIRLGPPRPGGSYLNQDAILEVARHTGCSAVHPGWGFLAENAEFAARCASVGLTFVGPTPAQLRTLGDKALARALMAEHGLPGISGSEGALPDLRAARSEARRVGYPVLLKAVAGGGGRGMRSVEVEDELAIVFEQAAAEARAAFGDGRLFLERRLRGARHVEVQVAGDRYGAAVHLGERDCSLQRRYQKIVEESPTPALDEPGRRDLLRRVAEAVAAVGYRGVGTLEFLVDAAGDAWFMEMNPRLQVEHGVTEERYGVDLVEWQLRIAANEPLPRTQGGLVPRGHAVEVRLNAEDPERGFLPSPGRIGHLDLPTGEGIRVDTHLRPGDRVPPDYDSLLAKVIATGATRDEALDRLAVALRSVRVDGVTSNLSLLERILAWEPFREGRVHTTSLEVDLLEE